MGTDPGDPAVVVRSLLRLLERDAAERGDKQRDDTRDAASGGDNQRDEELYAALLSQWRRSLWRKGSSTAGGLHLVGDALLLRLALNLTLQP